MSEKFCTAHFQTEMFRRLKIGVGQPPQNMTAPEYVLQPFALPAQSVIERACVEAADRLLELVASFRAAPPVEETLQRNTGQQENFTGLT